MELSSTVKLGYESEGPRVFGPQTTLSGWLEIGFQELKGRKRHIKIVS